MLRRQSSDDNRSKCGLCVVIVRSVSPAKIHGYISPASEIPFYLRFKINSSTKELGHVLASQMACARSHREKSHPAVWPKASSSAAIHDWRYAAPLQSYRCSSVRQKWAGLTFHFHRSNYLRLARRPKIRHHSISGLDLQPRHGVEKLPH